MNGIQYDGTCNEVGLTTFLDSAESLYGDLDDGILNFG